MFLTCYIIPMHSASKSPVVKYIFRICHYRKRLLSFVNRFWTCWRWNRCVCSFYAMQEPPIPIQNEIYERHLTLPTIDETSILNPDTPKFTKLNFYERHLTLPTIGKMEFQSLAVESLSSALPMQAAVSIIRKWSPTAWTAVASLSIEAIWFIWARRRRAKILRYLLSF